MEVIFANNAKAILQYTDCVLTCDIHSRQRTKRILTAGGAKKVYCLDEILTESVDGSGYNDKYGLLGSNKATEDSVKLFPIRCQEMVDRIHSLMTEKTGKNVEVMIYVVDFLAKGQETVFAVLSKTTETNQVEKVTYRMLL